MDGSFSLTNRDFGAHNLLVNDNLLSALGCRRRRRLPRVAVQQLDQNQPRAASAMEADRERHLAICREQGTPVH